MELILGHDLGSSGDKACIFDKHGKVLAEAYCTYETFFSADGGAVQKPEDWWKAVCIATKTVIEKAQICPKDIVAISFGAQGNALLPVDKKGNALKDSAVIWMDSRSRNEAKFLMEHIPEERYYEITGNAFERSMCPSAKLLYMKKNEGDILKYTYKIIGVKEYLILRLTGKFGFTDFGDASGSCMFDITKRKYSDEILDVVGVKSCILPEPLDCTEIVGTISAEASELTGLCQGTPVVLGTWDNFACATGAGVREKGKYVCYLGTAGWLGVDSLEPLRDSDMKLNVVYVGRGEYHNSAHSHAACMSLDWVLDNMCGGLGQEKYHQATEMAERIPAGCDGVLFLPSMLRGNTFFQDASLKSCYIGLRPDIHTGHLIRAAMEGVGYDLLIGVDGLKKKGISPKESTIIGGGAKNDLWLQILTDMFGISLTRPANMQHIGAWGAAMIACVGVGIYPDFESIKGKVAAEKTFMPQRENAEIYQRNMQRMKTAYQSMIELYKKLDQV